MRRQVNPMLAAETETLLVRLAVIENAIGVLDRGARETIQANVRELPVGAGQVAQFDLAYRQTSRFCRVARAALDASYQRAQLETLKQHVSVRADMLDAMKTERDSLAKRGLTPWTSATRHWLN